MNNIELLFNKFVGVIKEAEEPAVVDDGQDVIEQDVREMPGVEQGPAPQEELPPEDPNMQQDPAAQDEFAPPPAFPEMTDPNISETQKSINLLNLFLVLKQNIDKMKELFEVCDFTSVDNKYQREIGETEDAIEDLYHKVVVYITDNFASESYEKSLYIYVMLRNELLEVSKLFNSVADKLQKEKSDD